MTTIKLKPESIYELFLNGGEFVELSFSGRAKWTVYAGFNDKQVVAVGFLNCSTYGIDHLPKDRTLTLKVESFEQEDEANLYIRREHVG